MQLRMLFTLQCVLDTVVCKSEPWSKPLQEFALPAGQQSPGNDRPHGGGGRQGRPSLTGSPRPHALHSVTTLVAVTPGPQRHRLLLSLDLRPSSALPDTSKAAQLAKSLQASAGGGCRRVEAASPRPPPTRCAQLPLELLGQSLHLLHALHSSKPGEQEIGLLET